MGEFAVKVDIMPEDAPSIVNVVLADEVTSGQITVSLESYAEFCIRMESELDALKERFASFAAPGKLLVRRSAV